MTTFAETLQRAMWGKIGSQKLSKLTNIPKTKIDSWLQGRVQHPRDWRPILLIAQALLLPRAEADALLLAAGHPTIGELEAQVVPDHPDRYYLQPWLISTSLPLPSRHQLRAPIGDFVGRAMEITQLCAAIQAAAMEGVGAIGGVQGMGGIGKTELAYRVAHDLRAVFPDGQIVVAFHGTSPTPLPPEQALQTIIRAFTPDAKLPTDLAALEALYRAQLHRKRVLILIDDARDAAQVWPLLPPAGCALLVTSRTRFTLPAMVTIHLEQLPAADAGTFLRRICPRLTAHAAEALARACEYLPLALRVISSVLHNNPALPVTAYLARLADVQQRLCLLRDPDDRQLDVEAVLALSYDQLDAASQQVFRQLAVVVADFATEMALAVVVAPSEVDVEATLYLLLRRNLLHYDQARLRWRMHDLIRDVARQRLDAAGERDATSERYARAAVRLAEATHALYQMGGAQTLAAFARFDTEQLHIDAGRSWATQHAGTRAGDELLLDVTAATHHFDLLRYDARHERIPRWEQALAAARRLDDQGSEGLALNHLGMAYYELGEVRQAIPYLTHRLSKIHVSSDRRGEGVTLINLGLAYYFLGELRESLSCLEQAHTIICATGDRGCEGWVLNSLGEVYTELGETRCALIYLKQALAIADAIGSRRGEGITLTSLARAHAALGEIQQAIESCTRALTILRAIGDRRMEGYALSYLTRSYILQGNLTCATATFEQAVALFQETGDHWGEARCNWWFGLALVQQGMRAEALPLLRAAVNYEKAISHVKAAEHADLLACLLAGEALPV